MRVPRLALAMGLTACATPRAAAPAAPSADVIPSGVYAVPQQLVPVDGARRLNLFCVGSGSPTVVMDAGSGWGMLAWRQVQGQIGTFTRACAYDRAGHGHSDPAARPSDVINAVDDLHRLMKSAGITTPIVYVGHSLSGETALLFATTYPSDVAGAVLVDPAFAHESSLQLAELAPEQRAMLFEDGRKGVEQLRACLEMAKGGALVRPTTKSATDCVAVPDLPRSDDTLRAELVRLSSQPANLEAVLSEVTSAETVDGTPSTDDKEMDAISATFGDKMIVVLTGGKTMSEIFGGMLPADAVAKIDKGWRTGHERLASLSSRGSHEVVPDSTHFIQIDRPDVVIDAVRRVVMDVRRH